MKKDTTTIKRILRQTDNTNLHGYFQNEDDYIICNGYSIIKFDMNNIDFIADIDNLSNNTNGYYNYKSFNEHITKNQDARKTYGSQTIEILVEDLKMWKKHAEKGKPFIIPTKKGFMGLNPYYLLDLASLTRQDKNKLIKIKALDKKAPLYIDGNGVKAILCPIVLNKTDFNKDDYIAFLNKLVDCYDLEKALQDEKQLKKANAPKRNKKIKVSNMPIIIKNGVVCKDGYIYSDRNVDFFIYKNADNKTYTLYHLNSMLPCFTDCKSITAAIELVYDKLGEKSFIEKVIDIMQSNGAQARHDNAGATLATYGCLENVKHFIDKMIGFEPTPDNDNDNDTTKEETTTPDTCADDMSATGPETTETKTADNMSANNTTTAADTDTTNKLIYDTYPIIHNNNVVEKGGYYINKGNYDYIIIQNDFSGVYILYNLNYMHICGTNKDYFETIQDTINYLNAMDQETYFNKLKHLSVEEIHSIYKKYTPCQYHVIRQYIDKWDARQIETIQDKPQKTSKTAVSLFVVTDKPQPVKLYGANIPTLERIPTYTQRIISRFKPLKMQGVYNNRVTDIKTLKNDYMTFVSTVSHNSDKCASGGGMVAVNTS